MKLLCSFFALILSLVLVSSCSSQKGKVDEKAHFETPKLVVGIMVDQMRSDFIYRYWDKLDDGGFKRLLNEGFSFNNTHFQIICLPLPVPDTPASIVVQHLQFME